MICYSIHTVLEMAANRKATLSRPHKILCFEGPVRNRERQAKGVHAVCWLYFCHTKSDESLLTNALPQDKSSDLVMVDNHSAVKAVENLTLDSNSFAFCW